MFNIKISIKMPILIVGILIFIIINSCTSKKTEIVHPEFERLPSDSQVDYSIDLSKKIPNTLPQLYFLENLTLMSTIGENAEVTSKYYYPRDTDRIDIDPSGNLYFHQHHTNSIVVYNSSGKYLYTIGGAGRGPGEFTTLVTFAFDENYQTLYALDRFEIEIFELTVGKYEYKETFFHNFRRVFDMCLLGRNLYLSGFTFSDSDTTQYEHDRQRGYMAKATPPISRIDLESMESKNSFGFEYQTEFGAGYHEGLMSKMMLSCNQASNTIVGYQIDFPFIFGYDTTGTLKWASKINNLETPQYTEFLDPGNTVPGLIHNTQEGRVFRKKPIPAFNFKHYEMVQLYLATPIQRMGSFDPDLVVKNLDYHTFLLDTETGKLHRSDAYPLIKLIKDHTYIVAERDSNTFEHSFYIHEF